MQSTKYPYGEEFQYKILGLMAQDPTFMPVHHDAINPHYFERINLSTICQLLLKMYGAYRVVPDYASASASVEDHIIKAHVPAEVGDLLRQTIQYVYSNPVKNADHVREQVLRFGQRQALKGAVGMIIDKLEKDENYEDCRDIVEKALQVGLEKNEGLDFGQSLPNLPTIIKSSSTYSRRVPTGLPSLDACMGGGLGIGELGIIVAPFGTGKSTLLTNIGYGALMNQANVLHITCELKEIDIALKYGARYTGRAFTDIVDNTEEFQAFISHSPMPENRMKIKYFSPGTATTVQIRALLSYLRGMSFFPDVLIIDYIKKMKYDPTSTGSLGVIADELIAIGDDYRVAVWTAQQSQRGYKGAERTNVSGVANDISLMENCDVALAISQSEEEHKANRFRIETGKVRRGDDANQIACWCHYDRAAVWEMSKEEAAAFYGYGE